MITTTHTLKLPTGQGVTLTTTQLRELHTEIGKALPPLREVCPECWSEDVYSQVSTTTTTPEPHQ